jgi:hypothetical protein
MKGTEHRLWSCENARKPLAEELVAATFRLGRPPAATHDGSRTGQPHLELSPGGGVGQQRDRNHQ